MKQTLFILLFLELIAPPFSWAGAWLQETGTAYLRISSGWLSTRERYDQDGERVQWDTSGGGFRNARYRDLAFHIYSEVGVADGWNAILSGGWSRLEAEQPSAVFETYGFRDVTLGVKRRLTAGRTVTAAAAALTLPAGYDAADYPALGSDVTDLSLVFMAGTSGNRFWGTSEVEYRLRGGVFRNQVLAAVGGGWNPAPRVGLRAEARGGLAVGESPREEDAIRFDPATVDPDWLQLAATVSYTAGRGIAVEAEMRTTVAGKNTLAGTGWSLAVATSPSWRFRE